MMRVIPLLSLGILALPAHAALAPHSGLSGDISLNAGYASKSSNFNADGKKEIDSLNHKASEKSDTFLVPLGNIAYTFGADNQQQVYAGTAEEDLAIGTLAFQVGYKYQLTDGTVIDAAVLPSLISHDVWRDPFVTTSAKKKRTKSDADGIAYRLKLSNISGSPFSLDLAYGKLDIDHDEVTDPALRREGDIYHVKAQYNWALDKNTFVQPALIYRHFDADGRANRYDQYGMDVTFIKKLSRQQFALTAGYATRDFDHGSALFQNKVRDEDEYRLFAAYEYERPFNWQNWSLVALSGYKKTDSNIRFYDSSEYLVSLGAKYEF